MDKRAILKKQSEIEINGNKLSYIYDPKFYYYQFSLEEKARKNLSKIKYSPVELVDRRYLNNEENMSNYFAGIINDEIEINCDNITSPSLLIENFHDEVSERQLNLLDKFYNHIIKQKIEKPLILNLTIKELAFNDRTAIKKFIDSLEDYKEYYGSIYLVIARNSNSSDKLNYEKDTLFNILYFLYYLNYLGFKVTVGYTGLEFILYTAVGVNNIGTNISDSLKLFDLSKVGIEEKKKAGGRQINYYTSLPLLGYLNCSSQIDIIKNPSQKVEMFNLIKSDTNLDTKIISFIEKDQKVSSFDFTETQFQYMESIRIIYDKIKSISIIEDRINYIEDFLLEAIQKTKKCNDTYLLEKMPLIHLTNWFEAVNELKEELFI